MSSESLELRWEIAHHTYLSAFVKLCFILDLNSNCIETILKFEVTFKKIKQLLDTLKLHAIFVYVTQFLGHRNYRFDISRNYDLQKVSD